MYKFKEGNIVTLRIKEQDYYGSIYTVGKKNAVVYIYDINKYKKVALDCLTYVPPVIITPEKAQQFCRYEVRLSVLKSGHPDFAEVQFEPTYTMTFEDLTIALRNIKASGDNVDTIRLEWFDKLYYHIFEAEKDIVFENPPQYVQMIEHLPDRSKVLSKIFYDNLSYMENNTLSKTISDIISQIENILLQEHKPIIERDYSDRDKSYYISQLCNDDRLKKATKLELTVYRKFIDDLILKDNCLALRCKGYGCYGGDSAYECDWNTALECVTRLYELTGKPEYANTLGYIYYYGRCWNGNPKYDEAFKYFSIGSAGFNYESRYKLADMFIRGYGVQKNTDIAYTIICELYNQNIQYIMDGNFNCKFADVALRLGNCTENGYGTYVNVNNAYKYYLQADFAIKQRLQFKNYGDISVAQSIRQKLNSILESGAIKKPKKSANVDLYELLYLHLKKYRKLQLNIDHTKNGDIKLNIRIMPFKNEKYPPKLFITEEKTGFCGMLETLTIKIKNGNIIKPTRYDTTIYFDNICSYYEPVSETDGIAFMLGDKTQAIVIGNLKFTSLNKISKKKYRFASVYFSEGRKHYDYLLDIDDVKIGDTVYVMTDYGKTKVTVADIFEKTESELALPFGRYKKIIAKV